MESRAGRSFAKIFSFSSALFWAGLGSVWAGNNGGLQPAAYLNLGFGGREEAMGGAAVGLSGSSSSTFWNPAGITKVQGTEVEMEDTTLSLNRSLFGLSFNANYENLYYMGLTGLYYSDGNDLEARSEPTVNPDSVFSDLNLAFLATAAFNLSPDWDLGFNLKVFVQSYGLSSLPAGFGIGEDLGVQYHPSAETTLGFVAQDPFSDFLYSDGTDAIFPQTLRWGVAQTFSGLHLTGDLDLEWQFALGLEPHAGLEWKPLDAIAFRGGYWVELNSGQDGFGAGVGVFIPTGGSRMEFDYTLLPDRLTPGQLNQQITLTGNFF